VRYGICLVPGTVLPLTCAATAIISHDPSGDEEEKDYTNDWADRHPGQPE